MKRFQIRDPPPHPPVYKCTLYGIAGIREALLGIETAFECTILFSSTFQICDGKYWSGSTYHTFYKT